MGPWKKSLVFFILFPILVSGCATISSRQISPPVNRPAECLAFFENLDEKVEAGGVRNAAEFPISGFPYLRANRFLNALGPRLKTDGERDLWVRWMQELDREGRKAEIRNLPEEAVQMLTGKRDPEEAREDLSSRLVSCSERMRGHDQADKDFYAAVQSGIHIPDEYSTFLRAVGIHPLTAIPVAVATENFRAKFQRWFEGELAKISIEGKLVTYFPRGGANLDSEQITRILSEAEESFRIAPRPNTADLEKLAHTFAPVIVQDAAQSFDSIGRVAWKDGRIEILPEHPAIYYYFSHAFLNGKPILQIHYVAWYGARGGPNPPWFERGHLDGLTIRFSLDAQGK